MQLISCFYKQREHLGVVRGESVILPSLSGLWRGRRDNMQALIDAGDEGLVELSDFVEATSADDCVPLMDVVLRAPIPVPRQNIICLGWNYIEHAEESAGAFGRDADLPEHPIVFTKAVSSVNAPYGDILHDARVSDEMDWEVELGVIVGKPGRGISPQDALEHVFGYTVINDISARDLQKRHKQFFLGKSLDGACPMGPWIVTKDEIPDPQRLGLRCLVNSVTKQESNTQHQIFDVATTISILSRGMTLLSGTVIATGTPAGVGFARKPPEFLRPGDVVTCEVEGIGRIENRIVARTD